MKRLVLENECLRLTVEPSRGGKITELRDLRTGRQWLWENPYLQGGQPSYGDSYVGTLDTGGWDEIFPSVAPCQAGGRMIPDHGELVSLPWEVIGVSSHMVEMAVTTRFARCRFTRRLSLEGETLRVDYRLENHEEESLAYLWCAHPLFRIEAGMEIRLAAGVPMTIAHGGGVDAEKTFPWPHLPGLPALDRIPDPGPGAFRPFAVKLFTARDRVDEIELVAADGADSLRMKWEAVDAPFLGLWLNCGRWSGCGSPPYFNLGIEPATAPFDSLLAAMERGGHRVILAGEQKGWGLAVTSSVGRRCGA